MLRDFVYMTVLSNDKYIPGVKALKKSLRDVGSKYDLAILIPDSLLHGLVQKLTSFEIFDEHCFLCIQPDLNIKFPDNVIQDHYFNNTFFKLQCANCIQFKKIVLLDSDMLVLKNIDHLFHKQHYSAVVSGASRHPEWVDLNSGLMVLEPSIEFYAKLIDSIAPTVSDRFEKGVHFGDQDIFQETFPEWKYRSELRLPEKYNCFYENVNLVKRKDCIKNDDFYILHFVGPQKPWEHFGINKRNLINILRALSFLNLWQLRMLFRYLNYTLWSD